MNELSLLYLLRTRDEMKGQKLKKHQIERSQLSRSWRLHITHTPARLKLRRRPRLPFLPRLCKPVGQTLEWPGSLMLLRLSHPPTINAPTPHCKAPQKKARRKKQSKTDKQADTRPCCLLLFPTARPLLLFSHWTGLVFAGNVWFHPQRSEPTSLSSLSTDLMQVSQK